VKPIRPVLQGPEPITGPFKVATLAGKYKTVAGKRYLNLFASLARTIAKDCQPNHHQEGDEDYNDADLDCREQEADQRDQLFQQRDDKKNESDDSAESAKSFKNAATHIDSTPKKLPTFRICVRTEAALHRAARTALFHQCEK
jgi:hypothetical protein